MKTCIDRSTHSHGAHGVAAFLLASAVLAAVSVRTHAALPLPDATAAKLPRWRGFNLTDKFYRGRHDGPFLEDDFRLISHWGFNFVRLPMDYRCWIKDDDWTRFDEDELKEIDQAVEWGRLYDVHVCINFHRAPGYTVASPKEEKSLWTDAEAQQVCALHWATFARRYRGIPNRNLSFNLMNEPGDVEPAAHYRVVKLLVEAIRREDPERLIIQDGRNFCRTPADELIPLGIAQATRGYQPFPLTHYGAAWVDSTGFPEPAWPTASIPSALMGPGKKEQQTPLVVDCTIDEPMQLAIHVDVVSDRAHLVITADDTVVLNKRFVCRAGKGEWKKSVFRKEWNIHQNVYDRDYTAVIPAGTRRVTMTNTEGDWLSFSELRFRSAEREDGPTYRLAAGGPWGAQHDPVRFNPSRENAPFEAAVMQNRNWLWSEYLSPWRELAEEGVGVMVGEFGAYNKTPHDVTLRWMEDCLQNWKDAEMGWALWNMRGPFGILDSGRQDVDYEMIEDYQLDRKMLELLQRY